MAHVCFDKTKPRPDWLEPKINDKKNTLRGKRFYRHLWNAQPAWANTSHIKDIYRRAKMLRRAGHKVQVDHIVPLNHPYVCGLHVPWNLRIIDEDLNRYKSNHTWPSQYVEQLELFAAYVPPADFILGATICAN